MSKWILKKCDYDERLIHLNDKQLKIMRAGVKSLKSVSLLLTHQQILMLSDEQQTLTDMNWCLHFTSRQLSQLETASQKGLDLYVAFSKAQLITMSRVPGNMEYDAKKEKTNNFTAGINKITTKEVDMNDPNNWDAKKEKPQNPVSVPETEGTPSRATPETEESESESEGSSIESSGRSKKKQEVMQKQQLSRFLKK